MVANLVGLNDFGPPGRGIGISLGIGDTETERLASMRQTLDDEGVGHAPTWDELIERFGSDAPDGVRLAVVNRIQNPEPGCP